MGNETADGNGQAPTQPASQADGNGQAPATAQANNGSPAIPGSGGAPNGQAPTAKEFTPPTEHEWKRFQQELAEARRDAAKLTAERKTWQDAQMTAEEKRERDLADLQTKSSEYEIRLQKLTLENAGYKLGNTIGISDIGAALALVQVEHAGEINYDADHQPTNLQDLLKSVLKDHPALAASNAPGTAAAAAQGQRASSGGATNPGSMARSDSQPYSYDPKNPPRLGDPGLWKRGGSGG